MIHNQRFIITRSPLRVSFAGGGTDLDEFSSEREGHVISTAIPLFVYANLKDMFDANVRVHHSQIETHSIASRVNHRYSRAVLEHYGLFRGIELVMTSDIMTTGSGLGASSAAMAALALGASEYSASEKLNDYDFAKKIYDLERNSGTLCGRQDQYATVFGGLNSITFKGADVRVEALNVSAETVKQIEERAFLVYTNQARGSDDVQGNLKTNIRDKRDYLNKILEISYEIKEILCSDNFNVSEFGKIIGESWNLKKKLNPLSSNVHIDSLFDWLFSKGVTGGKVLGAGGGGFLLAVADSPESKKEIMYSLYPNYIGMDLNFRNKGTEVLWKNF